MMNHPAQQLRPQPVPSTPKTEGVEHVLQLLSKPRKHPRILEIIDEIETLQKSGSTQVLETIDPTSWGKKSLEAQSLKHILMVTGPTGIGKTTLAHNLYDQLLKQHAQEMQDNPSFVPALLIEARATSEADFNWKMLYLDALEALQGPNGTLPAVDYGIDLKTNRFLRPQGHGKNTAAALRKQVELALRARGVKALLIDEGGHFTNVSETRMKRQTDVLKSLSNFTGVQIICFGCYDILDISRLSSQLARRIKEIHFSRYRVDCPDDCIVFTNFLYKLEKDARGYFQGLLTKNTELLQHNTLGCIGTLIEVIRTFVSYSARHGGPSQTLLEKSLLTPGQHGAILEEIKAGEGRFKNVRFEL